MSVTNPNKEDGVGKKSTSKQNGPSDKDLAPVKQPLSAIKYAVFTFAFLFTGIAFAWFYLSWAPKHVGEDLDGRIYFLLLIIWGLLCASFLTGAMRGYASFKQKHLGTTIVLGGPSAVFFLIVLLGMRLIHNGPDSRSYIPSPPLVVDPFKSLMDQEAELVLSNSRDQATAERYGALFIDKATISDSGTPTHTWRGRGEIMARFRDLKPFTDLRHKLASAPSISSDGSVTIEATTEFLMENAARNQNPNGFGKERWTFIKEGDQWKIRSFRYNVP